MMHVFHHRSVGMDRVEGGAGGDDLKREDDFGAGCDQLVVVGLHVVDQQRAGGCLLYTSDAADG